MELNKDTYTKAEVQELLNQKDFTLSVHKERKSAQVWRTKKRIPQLLTVYRNSGIDRLRLVFEQWLEEEFDDVPRTELSTESSD